MSTSASESSMSPGQSEPRHPGWCSPDHCGARDFGRSHLSAPVRVGDLTLWVSQADYGRESGSASNALVLVEGEPLDPEKPDEFGLVVLPIHQAPSLTKVLLELYCATV